MKNKKHDSNKNHTYSQAGDKNRGPGGRRKQKPGMANANANAQGACRKTTKPAAAAEGIELDVPSMGRL
jgi:hypothetical protein